MKATGALSALVACWLGITSPLLAQSAPSEGDVSGYDALQLAAHHGDLDALKSLLAEDVGLETRDDDGRTPAIIAAFASRDEALRALAAAGADLNAMERRFYDVVTIAAVADDLQLLDLALELGADASNVTSPYHGTALIAAAHLGHHEVVTRLIRAGAPLDHVNNLGWTALMEAVVLGDGGPAHIATVRTLVDAGADRSIADRRGLTPLEHARLRDYSKIVEILEQG